MAPVLLIKKSTKDRSPRKCLSVTDKLKVIELLTAKVSQRDVAEQFGVSKTQIQQAWAAREIISTSVENGTLPPSSKKIKITPGFPEIERDLLKWLEEMRNPSFRCKPLPVSRSHILARALFEAEKKGITDFKASEGWFYRWRKRNGIGKSTKLYGEGGEVSKEQFTDQMNQFREELQDYPPEFVINMDESALFYKATPSVTYLAPSETRQSVRGTKALKAKDRLTVVFCCNATGTFMLDPLVIGTAKNPHCFRDGQPPVPYFQQKSAWVDKGIYKKWWNEIFLPAVRKWTKEPVALIMDNFSGHDADCIDPSGQVSVFFFPANSTSIHQPLDQGIIAAVKAIYKKLMLSKLIRAMDNIEELQRQALAAPRGRKGLRFGCSANVLDACQLLREAWDSVKPSSIVACWRHANCLPDFIDGAEDPSIAATSQKSVEAEICGLFEDLAATTSDTQEMPPCLVGALHVFSSEGARKGQRMIQRWLNLENEPDIVVADSILYAEEAEENLTAQDSSTTYQQEEDDAYDEERCARESFLASANLVLSGNIQDPVLIELARKVQNHISQKY